MIFLKCIWDLNTQDVIKGGSWRFRADYWSTVDVVDFIKWIRIIKERTGKFRIWSIGNNICRRESIMRLQDRHPSKLLKKRLHVWKIIYLNLVSLAGGGMNHLFVCIRVKDTVKESMVKESGCTTICNNKVCYYNALPRDVLWYYWFRRYQLMSVLWSLFSRQWILQWLGRDNSTRHIKRRCTV